MKENPASFRANETVLREIATKDAYDRQRGVLIRRILITSGAFFGLGVFMTAFGKGHYNQDAFFKIFLCVWAVLTMTALLTSDKWGLPPLPTLPSLERHQKQLLRLAMLTGTDFEKLHTYMRFGQEVVEPHLAAYLAGTKKLIELAYGEKSKVWYKNYEELYRISYELNLLPPGSAEKPESYESFDDTVVEK